MLTRERRQLRLFVRTRHLRPLRVLPGLPAPRPLHHRGPGADGGHPPGRAGRRDRRVHRAAQRVLHGPGALRGPLARRRADPGRRHARPRAPAHRRRPVLARRPGHGAHARTSARSTARGWRGPSLNAFPEAYKEDFTRAHRVGRPRSARGDRAARGDGIDLSLYEPVDAGRGEARLKVYRVGSPLSLSQVLPMLTSMGVEVDRRAALRARRSTGRRTSTTSGCRLRRPAACPRTAASCSRTRCARSGTATTRSTASTRLVLGAGLTWRQATVLRAYAKYMKQGNTPFALDYIEEALRSNVDITRLLVQLFEARFDPGSNGLAADARGADRPGPGGRGPDRPRPRRRGQPRPRPDPAVLPDPDPGHPAHQLLPGRRGRGAPGRTSPSSSSRPPSPSCPSPDRGTRSSSTRRGSRACTCASARWRAAACAGPTGATTSAPRCSAWSRRRWSRTP